MENRVPERLKTPQDCGLEGGNRITGRFGRGGPGKQRATDGVRAAWREPAAE